MAVMVAAVHRGSRASATAVRAPARPPAERARRPAGSPGPGNVLALQRSIGNAAVGRLVRADRQAVHRACCASCAAGHRCESEDEEELGRESWPGGRVAQRVRLADGPLLQRTIGDGHDLTSPRFRLIEDLEAAYDDERLIKLNDRGRGVQAIQQALYDLGFFPGPRHGADGDFGSETRAAVKAFQRANPPLVDDGKVGPLTMEVLDARFATLSLPTAAQRDAAWSPACVCSILCQWTPHTIDTLHNRVTVKSFDEIFWEDEEWDGTSWVTCCFPGGGYQDHLSSGRAEIGVTNKRRGPSPGRCRCGPPTAGDVSCEQMAEVLYHEVLHTNQPSAQRTTLETESYAYRIGEEFSIAAGLGGRPSLRGSDPRGREFADRAKVEAFVRAEYPSVPSGGGGEQIIGKASTHGHVRVRRRNGSIYTRPAVVGEKVPAANPQTVNERTHPASVWTCP